MTRPRSRPLSPHLTIWRWGPHMLVSILHRATGVGLATVGVVFFVWWLTAAAGGAESYASFLDWVTYDAPPPPPGAPPPAPGTAAHGGLTWFWTLILIGLTWAFLQHLANGVRHLVMDLGAGFELKVNKTGAVATMIFSGVLTLLLWAWILAR